MKYKITLNNRIYEVEVEAGKAMLLSEYDAVAPAAPVIIPVAAPAPSAPVTPVEVGSGEAVSAPMPGAIVKVNVVKG